MFNPDYESSRRREMDHTLSECLEHLSSFSRAFQRRPSDESLTSHHALRQVLHSSAPSSEQESSVRLSLNLPCSETSSDAVSPCQPSQLSLKSVSAQDPVRASGPFRMRELSQQHAWGRGVHSRGRHGFGRRRFAFDRETDSAETPPGM